MDIKPDVHIKRVFCRLGVSDEETIDAALNATRMMNPDYPSELDSALWWIGRKWCFASSPDCDHCPMNILCQKVDLNYCSSTYERMRETLI